MENKKRSADVNSVSEKQIQVKKKSIAAQNGFQFLPQLILFVVPLLLYSQTFLFGLSFNDDCIMLIDQGAPLKSFDLHKIFFSDAWMLNKVIELYRPLQSLTYAIDFLFGNSTGIFHIHNVLIFCIDVQLLYLFLRRININAVHALWLSLIFSVHFLLVHSVSWIPARGDLYLFAFSISSLIVWLQYFKTSKLLHLAIASLFYFMALLSKESAIVLIPLVIITGVLFGNFDWKKFKSYLYFIPSVFLTFIYLWMRSLSVYNAGNTFQLSGLIYNLPIVPEEVFKFFVPLFFSVMPAFNKMVTIGGVTVILVLVATFFLIRKKMNRKLALLGLAIFIIPFLPVLIYKPSFSEYAYDYLDHRMIFPGIGLLLIAYSLCESLFNKKYSTAVLSILIVVMSFISFGNTGNYKNYKSYFDNAIVTNPNSEYAWLEYGVCLRNENKIDEAIEKFKQATILMPSDIEARTKLANSYYDNRDYINMLNECWKFISYAPENPRPYELIAFYYSNENKMDTALMYISKAVSHDSTNAEIYFYRGVIFSKTGDAEKAIADFTKSVTLNPDDAKVYFERGTIYGKLQRMSEALADFNQYIKLNPQDSNGFYYRGQIYYLTGDKVKGCEDLHTAAQMGNEKAIEKIKIVCP